jgi:hypothetical protein
MSTTALPPSMANFLEKLLLAGFMEEESILNLPLLEELLFAVLIKRIHIKIFTTNY